MDRFFRKGRLAQAVVFLFILGLSSSGLAADFDSARVIPKGKVHIFEGAQKVGELSSEAPLPVGKILTSDQKFGVSLQGIYLVVDENTRFAVRPLSGGTDLFVEQGRVDFALNNVKDTLSLSTPQDTVTVQSTLIHASTDTSRIRGYLLFENDRMEIGVIDGGKLVVENARGQQMIESGSSLKFQHVQAELGAGGAGAGGMGATIAGAATAAAAGLGIVAAGDSDAGKSTSPYTP
ncbi:MAG: hypothetical protein ACQET7_11435 [Thermodesulfobacteriota bacterium]